jgi:hypothetical protein
MMRHVELEIPAVEYGNIIGHLLRPKGVREEAAFLFARSEVSADKAIFSYLDWYPIPSSEFAIHSAYHLEIDDETRARMIKKAHDMRCSLVEFHSHPNAKHAKFSFSDFVGLGEFVPHVWWRLKHRPYAAFVVAPNSVDGLAWIDDPEHPESVARIASDAAAIPLTGMSYQAVIEGEIDDRSL